MGLHCVEGPLSVKEGTEDWKLRKGSEGCCRRGEATVLFIIRLRSHFQRPERQIGNVQEWGFTRRKPAASSFLSLLFSFYGANPCFPELEANQFSLITDNSFFSSGRRTAARPWRRLEMATHSSVLAWRIPGTGEPGGLPSMGSHRVGHD